jgi:hypothetical protein
MSTTLQYALETLESLKRRPALRLRGGLVSKLAGKYKGLLPNGLTSSAYLRRLRDSRYGKFRLS